MTVYNCPTCESEETQNVVAIVDAETHHGIGRFFGRGRLRYHDGNYTDTQVSGSSEEVSRSQLAINLAPPEKRSWFLKALVASGLLYFQLDYLLYAYEVLREHPRDWSSAYNRISQMVEGAVWNQDYALLGSLAACLIVVPLFVRNLLYNILEYDRDYIDWSRQWYCHRCGSVFVP